MPATTTAGRRRARAAGPMRTCCLTSSAARNGKAARANTAAATARSAPNSPRRRTRSTPPGSKPRKAAGIPYTEDYNGKTAGRLRPQPIHDPRRTPLILGRGLSAAGARSGKISPSRPRAHATRMLMQGTRATGVEYLQQRQSQARAGGARGDRRERHLQHAAASDALGHRPGRASARARHQAGRRSAGGQESAGSSRRADHVRAARTSAPSTARCASTAWRAA